ncbi:MAG: ATP-binding protein [Halothece sp.]
MVQNQIESFDKDLYRVNKVRSRQTGNFGLGLSIVQQIVQVHGGQIKVHSVEQEGTTFEMEFSFPSKF